MSEREEVLTYFGWQTCVMGDECCHDECRIPVQMADEIVRLRSQLAAALQVNSAALDKAERERDEARRERDDAIIEKRLSDEQRARWMTENVALVHRAERAERVVEAAKAFVGASRTDNMALLLNALSSAVRALDAAEGKA